jgi:hypothetical protein
MHPVGTQCLPAFQLYAVQKLPDFRGLADLKTGNGNKDSNLCLVAVTLRSDFKVSSGQIRMPSAFFFRRRVVSAPRKMIASPLL